MREYYSIKFSQSILQMRLYLINLRNKRYIIGTLLLHFLIKTVN